jgi:hypothetical protein
VTLKDFEGGWGWDAQVRQYVRKKYRQDLAGLAALDPAPLARLLGGELVDAVPYAGVRWVLRLVPFRPLELVWLFVVDEEFGPDLRVYYAPKSLVVPTEDAYVFAWDYLAVLARYGRGAYSLEEAGPAPEWLSFTEFAPSGAAPIKDVAVGVREELMRRLDARLVEVAVARLDRGEARTLSDGWEVNWRVLGDLAFRLSCQQGRAEFAFDRHGARKYAPELLLSFAWLYINALLRECRQVDPSLPSLSRYL